MNKLINSVTPFQGVQLPAAFRNLGGGDELGAGITGGFGVVTFKGKVWRTKYRGEEKVLLAPDGRNPRPELEVVVVKASTVISKTFYKDSFVDGSLAPPDCWSVNGVVPDPGVPDRQSATCVGCKQNVWGSKITDQGKKAKACSDNKRIVIVPADDIHNESLGGPMMLRVPPTSLQDMKTFGDAMDAKGFPYYSFVTRLRFDPAEAYPKFVFEAIRPLTEDEAVAVIEMRDSPITQRILEAPVTEVHFDTDANQVSPPPMAKSAEELFTPAAAQAVAEAEVKAKPTKAEAPKMKPVKEEKEEERPLYNPMTGELIVYDDEKPKQQSFPDIPSGLKREKAAKPVKSEPKAEEVAVGGSFEDALDSLLGNKK